jgi:hypothetical protein
MALPQFPFRKCSSSKSAMAGIMATAIAACPAGIQ